MIKVGIIGYGYSAHTFHLPFIATSTAYELSAIYTSRPEVVNLEMPGIQIFESAKAMLDSGTIDLAIISSPNQYHYELAKLCLEREVHAVLEKPMVTSSAEASALIELTQTRSSILSVFHNRRWDGDFLTIKHLIEQNAVGDVRYFESHFDRFRPEVRQRWRELPGKGTGILWDLGPHLIDQALLLFGTPEAVTGRVLALRENSQTDDFFHVILHYSNREVVVHSSPFCAAPTLRFQVQGVAGSYVKFGLDPQEQQLKSGILPTDNIFGLEPNQLTGTIYRSSNSEPVPTLKGCYQEYFSKLAEAIEFDREPPVTAEEAAQVISIIELAESSSKADRTIYI